MEVEGGVTPSSHHSPARPTLRSPLLGDSDEERAGATAREPAHALDYVPVRRIGLLARRRRLYTADLFHTLVNTPLRRFLPVCFGVYALQLLFFGALYWAWALEGRDEQPDGNGRCLKGVKHFGHALWFSVQTAMTIGYGAFGLAPHPDCPLLNSVVLAQSMVSLLVDYSVLGLVYARMSRPNARARTLLFSRHVAMDGPGPGGSPGRLQVRVANGRKHALLEPRARMLLLESSAAGGRVTELPLSHDSGWHAGLPCTLTHEVSAGGPLAPHLGRLLGGTKDGRAAAGVALRLVLLVDAVDESTGMGFQARRVYEPEHVAASCGFGPAFRADPRDGNLLVDLATFDALEPAPAVGLRDVAAAAPAAAPGAEGGGTEEWRQRALAAEEALRLAHRGQH